MTCQDAGVSDSVSFFRRINREAVRARIPLNVSIALTHRCNLRCCHCYLALGGRTACSNTHEMSLQTVLRIIDECADAGSLSLMLTGGEPLLRDDFAVIYRHARLKGLLVAVFTNGTLLNKETVALFADLPPRCVEITIYGATDATHERVTGVPGSFAKTVGGLERLLAAGLNVKLKTMLMSLNIAEFHDMEKMAASYRIKFRFDAGIFPALDGSIAPLAYRVSPEEVVKLEFSDPDRAREWRDLYHRSLRNQSSSRLYLCSAGTTGFHVDACGIMRPCLLSTDNSYDLAGGVLAEGWRIIGTSVEGRRVDANFPCKNCPKKAICGYCPAFFKLESGKENVYSKYLCEIGQSRFKLVEKENLEASA